MKNGFEAAKFEPGPTFEETINDIKFIHIKRITSAAMNLSAITSFDEKIDPLSKINSFEAKKSKQNQHFKGLLMISKLII